MKADPVFNADCTLCPRLAKFLEATRKKHPDYYALPVPPFGDPKAGLVVVGLAPGMNGANRTGRPFTGDYAGVLLYATLYKFGFSNQPEGVSLDDGLKLTGCRINNSVKCVPPANKPLPEEIRSCNRYLAADLTKTSEGTVILALGRVAHEATLRSFGLKLKGFAFKHAAEHELPGGRILLDSYHCSRYNTQTKRLTPAMFESVVGRARQLLK